MPQQSRDGYADRVRLPMTFDAPAMRADLDRLAASAWIAHLVRANYDGDWDVLPLRMVAGATHPVTMIYADPGATEFVDTPYLAHAPYLRAVLARFKCRLQTARLMRLTPKSIIKPHRDHDLDAERGIARVHVPITTNPQVEFLLNGSHVAMAPGSAWYLRLSDTHSVANRGTEDRVHLVVDCEVDCWLAAMLAG